MKRLRRIGLVLLVVLLGLLAATWLTTDHFASFGGKPDPKTVESSPRYQHGRFVNQEPTAMMKGTPLEAAQNWLFGGEGMRQPPCPLPMEPDPAAKLKAPPTSGLRITWFGHSSTLIEIDGIKVLTDPQWSERASPSTIAGPKRFHPPPMPLDQLPKLDAVLISHDHYDHLDMETVKQLAKTGVTFHVGLGVGAHLKTWGVPDAQIKEHEWWVENEVAGVRVISTPARHFSGRLLGGDPTSWTSWALVGPQHRVYFSGDTGMTTRFEEIAQRLGPFDVAMLEIGQYHPSWGDIHLGPSGALDAFAMLNAKQFFPIHWSTFELGLHSWSGPAEDLVIEAAKRQVSVMTPKLGQPVEPGDVTLPWWRALPPIAKACP